MGEGILHGLVFQVLRCSRGRARVEERGVGCDVGQEGRCRPHTLVLSSTPCQEQKSCLFRLGEARVRGVGSPEVEALLYQSMGGKEWRWNMALLLPWVFLVLGARGEAPGGHSSSVRSHQAQGEAATRCLLDSGHRKGGDLGQRRSVTPHLKTAELPPTYSADSQLLDYVFFIKKKKSFWGQRLYAKHFFLPFPQFYCELKTALKNCLNKNTEPQISLEMNSQTIQQGWKGTKP